MTTIDWPLLNSTGAPQAGQFAKSTLIVRTSAALPALVCPMADFLELAIGGVAEAF